MNVVLASTWNPRGEVKRFRRLYPQLMRLFGYCAVVLPPTTHMGLLLSMNHFDHLDLILADDWPSGRQESLKRALDSIDNTSASHILYADMDRLLRWAETRYIELRDTVKRIQIYDYLVIERTAKAYATHPQALIQTEAISNRAVGHLVGKQIDLSAGAKGMHRDVAEFIVKHSTSGHALGTDAEWTVLAQRGGWDIRTYQVDGLDWESADRHADEAADAAKQKEAATAYDADPANWAYRVGVAHEIIQVGIDTLNRDLNA